jgi:hypothetical protein
MRVTPDKCLIGLVVMALLLAFWPAPSESDDGRSAVTTLTDATADIVSLRLVAKGQIARQVIEGRHSLVEAAALFRELNRLSPTVPDWIPGDGYQFALRTPAGNDEERLCRQVVEWVDSALRIGGSAASAEEAVARLEAEFRAAPRAHGVIRLPAASALTPIPELLVEARALRAAQERPRGQHRP